MTEVPVPLGRKEDLRLELKGREVLKDLFKVGREVVGMLNARAVDAQEGGEVWVGVREEGGRGVQAEPLADPDLERQRVRDYLVDSIEPAPTSELVVEVVEWEGRPALLRIEVKPDAGRRPYALLRGTGRHFLVRVEDRLRPMSREEIAESLCRQRRGAKEAEKEAGRRLREHLDDATREAGEAPVELFWIGLQPLRRLELKIQDPRFEELLREPEKSGNRAIGHHFIDSQWKPKRRQGWIGTRGEAPRRLQIHRDGLITGWAALSLLEGAEHGLARQRLERPVRTLSPWSLLEYTASVLRVAGRAYSESPLADPDPVLAELALLGIGGWVLGWGAPGGGGAPGRGDYLFRFEIFDAGDDLRLPKPEPFTCEEIRRAPDRCAFRLVRRVYEDFGFPDEAIPPEYDRRTGRLVLPEG